MMRLIKHGPEVPPDGYRYTFPDGTTIRQSVYSDWLNSISNHYEWNSIPKPENWIAIAEDQFCALMPPGWCRYSDGTDPRDFIDTRIGIGDLFRGMDVLKSLVTEPEPYVSQQQANERAAICASCPANITVPGCLPCIGFSNIVLAISGGRTTPHDHLLKQCAICRCGTAAMVHVKAEVLEKGVTADQMAKYQLLSHCWKSKEIEALHSAEQPA